MLQVVAALAVGAVIDRLYAKNITIYHVNEKTYGAAPLNMNTADINGDIYFDLRTRGLPLECGPWVNESFWSRLDCVNPEVAANPKDLAITKLELEVDQRWGPYADCNVAPDTGIYSCSCEDVPDNCTAILHDHDKCENANGCDWDSKLSMCLPYGCSNITDQRWCTQGYHKCAWNSATNTCYRPSNLPTVCNESLVGRLNLSTVEWGREAFHGHALSTVDYWHANTLAKTRGMWYSTWSDGECRPNDKAQKFCSWRVVKVIKKIAKTCSDASINAEVVDGDKSKPWGAKCFDKCTPADRKNSSSSCFILCFYANVLGPYGSSRIMNDTSPDFGMPVSELQAAWDRPFLPENQGGCPSIASTENVMASEVSSPVSWLRRPSTTFP